MSFLSEALLEVRYQPWYLYLTSLPKYKLVAGAAVTVTSLSLVLIIIVCSSRAGQYPADLVFPATACQTMQNISCIFPFSYKGVEYSQCTTADNHGVPWCSTGTDHRGRHMEGQWGNCNTRCARGCSTVSGPDTGSLCMFPFKWNGTVYRECTTHMNSGKLWCPTQLDHLNGYIEDMWGNCDPDTCTGCRTVEGSTCHLPFVYKNVTHDECTMEDSDSLWCHTGGVDDNHQLVRGECQPGCAIGCHTHLGTRCVFPFTFQGKTFTSRELDRGSRQELTRPGLRWCATEVDSEGEMVQGYI